MFDAACYELAVGNKLDTLSAVQLQDLRPDVRDSLGRALVAVRHFFPHLAPGQCRDQVRETCFNSSWATLDVEPEFLEGMIAATRVSGALEQLEGAPKLFCGFHYGSYKLAPAILARAGLDVVSLVSGDILGAQVDELILRINDLAEREGWRGRLHAVDANAPGVLKQLAGWVKRGASVFIYPDGNSGTGGIRRRDEKLVEIDFLGARMRVRKGLAAISQLCRIDVVPLTCLRTSMYERELVLHPALPGPAPGLDRDAAMAGLVSAAFQVLADHVRSDPAGWEAMLYALNWLVPRTAGAPPADPAFDPGSALLQLDQARYEAIEFSDGAFLVDCGRLQFARLSAAQQAVVEGLRQLRLACDLDPAELAVAHQLARFGALRIDQLPQLHDLGAGRC